MKSLLDEVKGLDVLIRQLYKLNSKMKSGQFIEAWRELNRIIASLEQNRDGILKDSDKNA